MINQGKLVQGHTKNPKGIIIIAQNQCIVVDEEIYVNREDGMNIESYSET